MKKIVTSFIVILMSMNNSYADSNNGKKLHQEKCGSCHMVADHSALYVRKNRMVNDYPRLKKQVGMCKHNLNVEWFPDEEQDVVNYLNEQYYHFKK